MSSSCSSLFWRVPEGGAQVSVIRNTPSQRVLLPEGHQAERWLDSSLLLLLLPHQCGTHFSFLTHPPPPPLSLTVDPLCSLAKPLSSFLRSLSLVKQIASSSLLSSTAGLIVCLFFSSFLAPSDPLLIHFRGCGPEFICHCWSE